MKEICITAVEMPGNIQKPFYELQTELFSRYKIPGARLLPPVIPLFPEKLSRAAAARIQKQLQVITKFQASTAVFHSGRTFYSTMKTYPLQHSLEQRRQTEMPQEALFLFPQSSAAIFLAEGLFPQSPEKCSGAARRLALSLPEMTVSWKKMYVAEIRIQIHAKGTRQSEMYWEYTKYMKAECGG